MQRYLQLEYKPRALQLGSHRGAPLAPAQLLRYSKQMVPGGIRDADRKSIRLGPRSVAYLLVPKVLLKSRCIIQRKIRKAPQRALSLPFGELVEIPLRRRIAEWILRLQGRIYLLRDRATRKYLGSVSVIGPRGVCAAWNFDGQTENLHKGDSSVHIPKWMWDRHDKFIVDGPTAPARALIPHGIATSPEELSSLALRLEAMLQALG